MTTTQLGTPDVAATGLLSPLRMSPAFRGLWIGQSFSRLGDAILYVVLPLLMLTHTHSTLDVGILMALMMIPQVILLPFGGVWVDRVSRLKIMLWSDIIRLLCVGGLALLTSMAHFHLIYIDILCFVLGGMDGLFQPAYAAMRAQVFTPDIRNAANALTQGAQQVAGLAGPALGGLLMGLTGATGGFLFDSLTFMISIMGLLLSRSLRLMPAPKATDAAKTPFIKDLMGGVHALKPHPWLWVTILVATVGNFVSGGLLSILVPWLIKIHFKMSSFDYGLVSSALGVGAVLAAVIFGRRSQWRRRGPLCYIGLTVLGLATGVMPFFHSLYGLLPLMAVGGAGVMFFGLIWESSLQELIPDEAYGRVASLDLFGSFAFVPVGDILTGYFAQWFGGVPTMMVESGMMCIIALGALTIPAIRRFD